jgi:N-acetylglutamate synthase-like GNAT family acetyltransferase
MEDTMTLRWIRETPAHWDASKARIVGDASPGIFDSRYKSCKEGEIVPGEWWRVDDEGKALGYGWLDVVWGDAEILLAADPEAQKRGIGTFILARLDEEARTRGLNYLYNMVRPTHPRAAEVTAWLERRGFQGSEDGRLLRGVKRSAR